MIDRIDSLLVRLQMCGRQIGKTHAAAELTKRVNGVMVCLNHKEARRVAETYGVRTAAPDQLWYGLENTPIVVDQDAFARIVSYLLKDLRAEREAHRKTRDKLGRIQEILESP